MGKQNTYLQKMITGMFVLLLMMSMITSSLAKYETLEYGMSGSAVQELQEMLQALGYDPDGIDSKYGYGTKQAVMDYQRANGLTYDGKAGDMTRTHIYAAYQALGSQTITPSVTATPSGTSNPDTLEYGDQGAEVLALQQMLTALGYQTNGVDGKYGAGTQSAVQAYQSDKGLTVDGKAGTKTRAQIESDFEAIESGSSNGDSSSTDSTYNPNTLKYGDSGDKVTQLQTALTKLGYDTSGVDGKFGAGTQRAVIAFQQAQGLTADGLAGTKTQELLYSLAESSSGSSSDSSSSDSSSSTFTRTLRKGYTGDDVIAVQQKLQELGYYTGSIDGVYGTGSIAAVKSFQQNNGLTADGLCGSSTHQKLFSSSAVSAGNSSSGSDSSNDSSSGNASTYVSLRLGATGDDVKALQKALKELDYNVSADGSYGALTVAAVEAFQKRNGLTADGVAGVQTQTLLFSGNALSADTSSSDTSSGSSSSGSSSNAGSASGPSTSEVQLLHWFDEVKPSISTGQTLVIFDPATNLQWNLKVYSCGNHADSEPLTAEDTAIMYKAFGYTNTWTPKPVYVKLPSGKWTLATMHNVAHLSGSISDNDFDGHLCVHFLRDMDEVSVNDPNYGVTHQNQIRETWKQMTGITLDY